MGLSKLPLNVLYVLADVVFFVGYHVVRYRRNIARQNLRNSFPDKSAKEIKAIEIGFFRHLCDILAETLKNIGGDEVMVTSRLKFTNIGLLKEIYESGKSITLYTGHYGNWEWLTVLPLYVPFRMIAFYQPLSNSLFDNLMKESREKYGITAIPSSQAYRALKEFSDQGVLTLSLVLGDQSPPLNGPKVWIDFLNQSTAFLPGANKIARKLGQVVVYPHFTKVARGNYEVEMIVIHPGEKDTEEHAIIKNYARQLEKSIRKDPTLWLWSHRRWKLKPGNG
jgi:KDO2-lipid IV(A) lauroyltransferase